MKSIAEMRKEKQLLISYVNRCKYYISLVNESLEEIGKDYRNGRISQVDYQDKVHYGLEGKSFRYYISLYNGLIKKYESRIVWIDDKINKQGKNKGVLISTILILVILTSSFFIFDQGDITGRVVFSMVESNMDIVNKQFSENDSFVWTPENLGRLNTLSLTGEYVGEGIIRIYLDLEEESKLIYAAEGSSRFESECGNACYLYDTSQDEYNIRIEMPDGGRLDLGQIHYLISELEEFKISPLNITVNLTDNRFIRNKFGIYNSRNKNFSVAIYAEGELTEYTTLDSSYEGFQINDSMKYISYDIDLPLKIEPGVYNEKIIVRYLPDGKFMGEAPVEEHIVTVRVSESELEVLTPSKTNLVHILLILLGFVILINIIMFLKRKKA